MALERLAETNIVAEKPQTPPIPPVLVTLEQQSEFLLNENGGRIGRDELLTTLFPLGNHSPRSLESPIQSLKRKKRQEGKSIRYTGGDNGVYEEMDISPIGLPDGTSVEVDGLRQREALSRMAESRDSGLSPTDFYGEHNNRTASSLEKLMTKLRKQIQGSTHSIVGETDEEGVLRYYLRANEPRFLKLPDGTEVEGLTRQERQVAHFLLDRDLPTNLSELHQTLMGDKDFDSARRNLARVFSVVNKALGEKGAITRVSRIFTTDSAYWLITPGSNQSRYLDAETPFINRRIKEIEYLVARQETNHHLKLTDEANVKLNKELSELKSEKELRKMVDRLQKQAKQSKSQRRKEPPDLYDDLLRVPPLVKSTAARFSFADRGRPDYVLAAVGSHAYKKAQKTYDPESTYSFEEYAEFFIRGAMGNAILYFEPERIPKGKGIPLANQELKEDFKKDTADIIVEMSSRRRHPDNFLTSEEARAFDICFGITGRSPGTRDDVALELECGPQWADRLVANAIDKLKNSPRASELTKYFG